MIRAFSSFIEMSGAHWLLRLRGHLTSLRIRSFGGECGSRLLSGGGVHFRYPPHEGIRIGTGVVFGRNVVIDVPPGGRLVIGDRVKLTTGAFISAHREVRIGDRTMIAEFSSVRDADHGIAPGEPIIDQPLITEAVRVGADVWIGRGVAVLRGSSIGDGAVIGANAVVRGAIPGNGIAVGAPARVVKYRDTHER